MPGTGVTEMGIQYLVETQFQFRKKKIVLERWWCLHDAECSQHYRSTVRMVKLVPFTTCILTAIQDRLSAML